MSDEIYRQRNTLAIALACMILKSGGTAGRGTDPRLTGGPSDGWSHVLYIDLPDGTQISYHFAPPDVNLLDGLPEYRGEWDGTYAGRKSDWLDRLKPAGAVEFVTN